MSDLSTMENQSAKIKELERLLEACRLVMKVVVVVGDSRTFDRKTYLENFLSWLKDELK